MFLIQYKDKELLSGQQNLIKSLEYYPVIGESPLAAGFVLETTIPKVLISWNFGKDTPPETQYRAVSYTYRKPGIFEGSVTVTDKNDHTKSSTQEFKITVNPQNGPIMEVVINPPFAKQNEKITFGINANLPGSAIKEVVWHYGDHSDDDVSKFGNAYHTYQYKGKWDGKVTLRTGDKKEYSKPFGILVY